MKRISKNILGLSIVLFFALFLIQFCFAAEGSNISPGRIQNNSEVSVSDFAPPLSFAEKLVWGIVIFLIVVLVISIFVLAYLLSKWDQNKLISNNISIAEKEITRKGVERAKRLN